MAFRDLPTFYYHTHFMEFLDFIKGPSLPLLSEHHLAFLQKFDNLNHLEQCLVVRLINRKLSVIKKTTLKFEEIPNIDIVLSSIIDKGFATQFEQLPLSNASHTSMNPADIKEHSDAIIAAMTKPELYELYTQCANANSPPILKSANKAIFSEHCAQLEPHKVLSSQLVQGYVLRLTDNNINYFLFLYFGHGHGKLNQFSMRDLGIMRTREEQAQMQSRFSDYNSAYSAFALQQILHRIKNSKFNSTDHILDIVNALPRPYGMLANEFDHNVRFKLAKALFAFDPHKALLQLAHIESPQAQEYWCRQAYKLNMKDEVEARLNLIIDTPLSDRLLQFAEDFLARKYHKKRTSVLTDMLRENNRHLLLDETFKGSVEAGVVAYYQARGIQAWRTENHLWQNLFGLCFWPELFEIDGLGLATPFDYIPLSIKQHCFLDIATNQIHQRLNKLQTSHDLRLLLTKHCAKYFGHSQGVVSWHKNMLDTLNVLIAHAPLSAIKQQLLAMCANWTQYNDGFPDIMVLENQQLRFEEIKAQGDSLRRNQLMQIQGLKQYGFDVGITTVDWTMDPMQPYAVIDIETTGGRAGIHKITEIGIVKMVNGEVIEQWQSLINPERRIPSMITALTGISNDMVADAPLFVDIADEVDKFTENCIFVAHNVNFDYGFIREEFARLNRVYKRPKLCTVQQMRKHFSGLPSYSLANLTRHFNIGMQRHHRALSDAVAACELLKMVNQARVDSLAE